jgi:hypothetical protein
MVSFGPSKPELSSLGSRTPRRAFYREPRPRGTPGATDLRAGGNRAASRRFDSRTRAKAPPLGEAPEPSGQTPSGVPRPSATRPGLRAQADRGADRAATLGRPASRLQRQTLRGPPAQRTHRTESPSGPRLVRFASRPPSHLPSGRRRSDRPAASHLPSGRRRSDRFPGQPAKVFGPQRGQPSRRSSDRWWERRRGPSGAKAQGSIGRLGGGNADRSTTDFAVEQHPEVGRPTDGSGANRGNTGGPTSRNRKQRREGIGGRRRATTYAEGKASKGVTPPGKARPAPSLRATSRASWKRGEPHGRMQGATNLQGAAWSKPPKSGRTARAEHVRSLATPGRRAGLGSSGSGHAVSVLAEGRSLMNPKRVVQTSDGRTFGPSLS